MNAFGRSLIETLRSSSMVLLNGRAPGDEMGKLTCKSTRKCDDSDAGSVVDVACVSVGLYANVTSFNIYDDFLDGSSHRPFSIYIDLPVSCRNNCTSSKKVKVLRPSGRIAQHYAAYMQARVVEFEMISDQLHHNTISSAQAITSITHIISECMMSASVDGHTSKTHKSYSAPWWCDELTTARDNERRLRRLSQKSMADQQAWVDAKKLYRRLMKHYKMLFQQQHQMELIQSYFSESQGNFWKAISPPHAPCILSDVDEWTHHFDKVINPLHNDCDLTAEEESLKQYVLDLHATHTDTMLMLNAPIELWEVERAIAKLPNMKAAGADGIAAECFKTAFVEIDNDVTDDNKARQYVLAPVMMHLLNAVFIKSDFPTQFAINTLTPIYKGKGDAHDMNNYRGIAVGSVFCKIFESILYHRYNNALEDHNLRSPYQLGFRRNHGTLDGLFGLRHMVDKAKHEGRPLYALFIDFEKAFDRVPRDFLVERCKQLGCSGPFLTAMINMLEDIQMQVKCDGSLGKPIKTSKLGIKQGGLLSPVKFGSFMEQLLDLIMLKLPGMGPKIADLIVPILMYADDVTALVTSPDDMAALIHIIELFCRLFGMKLNASKTFAVIFNNPKKSGKTHAQLARKCQWKIGEHDIRIEHESKFLGNVFHYTKGCEAAPSELAAKGRKASHLMMAKMKGHFINQSAFLCRMFDQLVRPVLSYGCQIWGPDVIYNRLDIDHVLSRKKNPLEAVHIDFMRYLGGLPKSSPLWILYNEFQRTPLHFHWLALCARFWTKATTLSQLTHPNSNILLRNCMVDNIHLMVTGSTDCWVAKFMHSMAYIGIISHQDLKACKSVVDYTSLQYLRLQ